MIYKHIQQFNNELEKEIPRIIENIKYQYSFHNLSYKLDEPIVVSKILNEINLVIDSKKKLSDIGENTVYINVNPFALSTGSFYEPVIITMINKNIWVLFYKYFEKFLINLCVSNIKSITVQNNYVCKQFYNRIKHLPVVGVRTKRTQ